MRPAAGTEHPLRGAEYSGAESVARGSLLSDHAVDVSDKLCAVSFLQLVGIKINNCLIFEEKFRDELRSTGSPPSSTTLASHRQKLVSGTSRSVRRAGSALLRQSRCLSKHRPLRGRGTRFSPSPLCVKTVRVTQCRTEEQLVGPSLTQGGGGVWHPRRGPCQERTTRWDFTSGEVAAQRRGARRAQDTGAGCRGARRGPPFMRRQDHTAVPSRPPEGPVGAVSAAHTKRETAQSTFSRDSRGFSLRCQGPSAGCVSVPSLSSGSPVGRRLSPWSTVETGTRAWASSEAASAGRQWQPQPLLCAQHCGGCGGPWGGGDSHPELGHDARAQMPDGIGAPCGVLQGFGGGTGVARADGAPTPRAREEAG